jgi:large subunit ribosomal protein L4e
MSAKTKKTEKTKAKAVPKKEPKKAAAKPKASAPKKREKKATEKTKAKPEVKTSKPKRPLKHKESRQKRKKLARTTKHKLTKIPDKKDEAKKIEKEPQPKKPEKIISGSKEVNLYSISGKSTRKIKLPIVFDEIYRLDLIRRAVKAARANRRQPYGPSPISGMQHSTSTWGKGRGVARVQRLVDGRRAVESPNNVGGRRAHPPTVEKIWAEKINKKERKKARRAALAAVTDSELVASRGHQFDKKITLPLIIEDDFEKVQKTKKALEVFQKVGVYNDIVRAENGKHIRSGKGKTRGRRYRRPKSLLIVVSNKDELKKGVGNLIGVDIVTPELLSIEDLAPGGDPGRLTIITESALKLMNNW